MQMRKLIRGDDAEADSWHNMLSQRPTGSSPLAASDSDGESTSASASKSTAAEDGDAGISAGVGAGVRAGDPFGNYFALVRAADKEALAPFAEQGKLDPRDAVVPPRTEPAIARGSPPLPSQSHARALACPR